MPIFFLTDFGTEDTYVGVMKAVAISIGVNSRLIDLTHGIPPQAVRQGFLALEDALPYLPERCVVCAVVDPGVGTRRRAIAVRAGERYFVGPDNGLLSAVFAAGEFSLREIAPGGPIMPQRSATFHGRDVFAPAAALLASGGRTWENIGPLATFPKRLAFPPVTLDEDGKLTLQIIAIDHFGNLTTNLKRVDIPSGVDLRAGEFRIGRKAAGRLRHTFEDVSEGSPVVYFNASDRLELGISMGSAADEFSASVGDEITFRPAKAK